MPAVSVVMPMRDAAQFVGAAVESVLSRADEVDLELVVVDDGSVDEGPAIVSALNDPRVTLLRLSEHRGISAALNAGISHSTAPYLARMDADDLSLPGRFVSQIRFLDWAPDVVAVGTPPMLMDELDATRRFLPLLTRDQDLRRSLTMRGPFCHGSVMMRRTAFHAAGGYVTSEEPAEDYGLWVRLAAVGSLANLAEPLYCLRLSAGSVSSRREADQLARRHAVREQARATFGDPVLRWSDLRAGKRFYAALSASSGRPFAPLFATETRELACLDTIRRGVRRSWRNVVVATAIGRFTPGACRHIWRFYKEERELAARGTLRVDALASPPAPPPGSARSVLFTTNYSMPAARAAWEAGEAPGHHLWGTPALEQAGYRVDLLPYREPMRYARMRSRLRSRFGAPGPELAALRSGSGSILYAADRDTFIGFGVLGSLGARIRRTVAVINPVINRGPLRERAVLGYDVAIALSDVTYQELLRLGRRPDRTFLLGWGPDLGFQGYVGGTDEIVVSSGKTRRDVQTLLRALAPLGVQARVHVPGPLASPPPPNVDVAVAVPYAEVLGDLRRASVVAIPLLDEHGPVGITELNDALALAKPVVMTRNRHIDVDIEAVGCGIWVERGDVDGWRSALARLAGSAELRAEMGGRGLHYARRSWNAERFAGGVVEAFSALRT